MIAQTNVVIVCWNALEYTRCTIDTLFQATSNPYYLTIIDNGSAEDTRDYLSKLETPDNVVRYTLIVNSANKGIGFAYNQGYAISSDIHCKYTAFCNNDLFFSSGWLGKMEAFMNDNTSIAMTNPIRPSVNDMYPLKKVSSIDILMMSSQDSIVKEVESYTGRPFKEFETFCEDICKWNTALTGQYREVNFPDSLSSCVSLVRNSSLRKYGYFANPLFSDYGGEDIDMCWTLLEDGYRCAVMNDVYVHHFRGKSMQSNNDNVSDRLNVSNRKLYNRWKTKVDRYMQNRSLSVEDLERQGHHWLLSRMFSNMEGNQ